MNRRGISITTQWIVHLVFLMMVIAIFLSVTIKLKDNKLHNLRVEARDYAFTRDMLLATPNLIDYKYTPKENVIIEINKDRCLVQTKYKNQQSVPTQFFCAKNDFINLQEQMTPDNNIRLIKNE